MKKLRSLIRPERLAALFVGLGLLLPFLFFGHFLLRLLAAYLLPGCYVHRRLKNMIAAGAWRRRFSVFFLIVVGFFPLAEILAHASGLAAMKYPLILGIFAPERM